jgi:hypothetical protein
MNERVLRAPSDSHFKCPGTLPKKFALPGVPISFTLKAIASVRRGGTAKPPESGVLLRRHNAGSGIAGGPGRAAERGGLSASTWDISRSFRATDGIRIGAYKQRIAETDPNVTLVWHASNTLVPAPASPGFGVCGVSDDNLYARTALTHLTADRSPVLFCD